MIYLLLGLALGAESLGIASTSVTITMKAESISFVSMEAESTSADCYIVEVASTYPSEITLNESQPLSESVEFCQEEPPIITVVPEL